AGHERAVAGRAKSRQRLAGRIEQARMGVIGRKAVGDGGRHSNADERLAVAEPQLLESLEGRPPKIAAVAPGGIEIGASDRARAARADGGEVEGRLGDLG